jgi:hypothetical protein
MEELPRKVESHLAVCAATAVPGTEPRWSAHHVAMRTPTTMQ